ncbi:hypothetical protein K32_24410 [Kaistia sp. 32K]|nr:hypothetical protein K32_24410 [Kaistia sp. 32K]
MASQAVNRDTAAMNEDRQLDSSEAIGLRIVQLRKALGFERANSFARFLGIETNTLGNYEVGLRRPSLEFAAKICGRTGITLDWLYWGSVVGLPVNLLQLLQSVDEADQGESKAG